MKAKYVLRTILICSLDLLLALFSRSIVEIVTSRTTEQGFESTRKSTSKFLGRPYARRMSTSVFLNSMAVPTACAVSDLCDDQTLSLRCRRSFGEYAPEEKEEATAQSFPVLPTGVLSTGLEGVP